MSNLEKSVKDHFAGRCKPIAAIPCCLFNAKRGYTPDLIVKDLVIEVKGWMTLYSISQLYYLFAKLPGRFYVFQGTTDDWCCETSDVKSSIEHQYAEIGSYLRGEKTAREISRNSYDRLCRHVKRRLAYSEQWRNDCFEIGNEVIRQMKEFSLKLTALDVNRKKDAIRLCAMFRETIKRNYKRMLGVNEFNQFEDLIRERKTSSIGKKSFDDWVVRLRSFLSLSIKKTKSTIHQMEKWNPELNPAEHVFETQLCQ